MKKLTRQNIQIPCVSLMIFPQKFPGLVWAFFELFIVLDSPDRIYVEHEVISEGCVENFQLFIKLRVGDVSAIVICVANADPMNANRDWLLSVNTDDPEGNSSSEKEDA